MALQNHSGLTNKNLFTAVQAEFSIKRLPSVEFYCQRVTIPGIWSTFVLQPTPLVDIKKPGDKPTFGELKLEFLVDEYLVNYMAVHDWIRGLTFPDDTEQYRALAEQPRYSGLGPMSDCMVVLLDSKSIPKLEVNFVDAFPLTLTEINLDTTLQDDIPPITATMELAYTSYSISRIAGT